MFDRNRIRQTAVQIRYSVNIDDRCDQRHTARSSAKPHQTFPVSVLLHILRLPVLTVRRYNFTCNLGFKKCIKIKRINTIWVFIKDQIHVHQALFFYKFPKSVYIFSILIRWDHTVSRTSRLLRHIIHCIAGSCRDTDHMGWIPFFFHKKVQNTGSKYSSCSPAL